MTSTTVNRKRLLIIVGTAGCLLAFLAMLIVGGGMLVWRANTVSSTPETRLAPTLSISLASPTPNVLPITRIPPAPTSIVDYQIYQSKASYFSVSYPRGWLINDQEKTDGRVTFTAPDRTAQASVKVGATISQSPDQSLNTFINEWLKVKAPDVRVTSPHQVADGAASTEVEYTNADLGGRARGLVRIVALPGEFYYAVMFSALTAQYDPNTASKFVQSLNIGK
jgi:hypothetical protein